MSLLELSSLKAPAPLAGEISLLIWLLVKGVDEGRWCESARGSCEAPRAS